MFIKRAKSRPSIRARDSDIETTGSPLAKSSFTPDDPAEDVEDGGRILERKKAQKKEKRKDELGKTTRLSFGGDDDGGEGEVTPFKPKKSLLSQSLKLPSTPLTSSSAAETPSTLSSVYSREYLCELKASTPSRAPRRPTVEDDEDDDMDRSGLSRLARNKYAPTIVEDTTAGIPDAVAIASAKSKRQAAVENVKHNGNLGEDYIALGGEQIAVYDGTEGPHPESRLMREEDEGEEGDEDMADFTEVNDRLHLGKGANRAAARRLKGEIGELIDEREAEDEDDEETREWEMAQARRAGRWEDEQPEKPEKRGHQAKPIPTARPLPSLGLAQARLAKSQAELNANKSENEKSLEAAERELAMLEEQEQELRQEVERVEGKREWVEEFRGWIEMLGGFLEEKMPKLQEIEADAIHHLKERAELVGERRTADDRDDLALFLGAPAPTSDTEEVDDMNRSRRDEAGPSSGVRRVRRSEREGRRLRRRARAARPVEEDGFSTDSTLAEGDAEDYEAAQGVLDRRVVALLEDVKAEDFRDPDKGLAVRFGQWRSRYEEEYVNAFGGLAMVQAWEFWARGEMVNWEPLRGSSPVESLSWYTSLYRYSRPHPPTNGNGDNTEMDLEDEPELGPDGDLVSDMLSKAVVPLLTKEFEAGAYDLYSAAQTRRAIDLVDVVQHLTGKDSRKFTALLKAVLGVYHTHLLELSSTIAAVTSPSAIPPPAFDPAARPAMERYVRRRTKLLRNMLLWRREAPQEVRELVTRLVGEVLRPALGRNWGGGGQEMAAMASFPDLSCTILTIAKVRGVAGTALPPDLVTFLERGLTRGW